MMLLRNTILSVTILSVQLLSAPDTLHDTITDTGETANTVSVDTDSTVSEPKIDQNTNIKGKKFIIDSLKVQQVSNPDHDIDADGIIEEFVVQDTIAAQNDPEPSVPQRDSEENTTSVIPEIQHHPERGTITVTSTPEGAEVLINNTLVGKTPYDVRGFLPGYYEVIVKKDTYEEFRKMIQLPAGGKTEIQASLVYQYGKLHIQSNPPGAMVFLNYNSSGKTPFFNEQIEPGSYRLRLDLDSYGSTEKNILIEKGKTDSLFFQLISTAILDSISAQKKGQIRIASRIVLGCAGVICGGAGYYMHRKSDEHKAIEDKAYQNYENLGSGTTTTRFDAAWERYENAHEVTESYKKKRNALYILGGVFAAGLVVTISF